MLSSSFEPCLPWLSLIVSKTKTVLHKGEMPTSSSQYGNIRFSHSGILSGLIFLLIFEERLTCSSRIKSLQMTSSCSRSLSPSHLEDLGCWFKISSVPLSWLHSHKAELWLHSFLPALPHLLPLLDTVQDEAMGIAMWDSLPKVMSFGLM